VSERFLYCVLCSFENSAEHFAFYSLFQIRIIVTAIIGIGICWLDTFSLFPLGKTQPLLQWWFLLFQLFVQPLSGLQIQFDCSMQQPSIPKKTFVGFQNLLSQENFLL